MSRRQRRILVVRPDRIGDVALATPVIRALRRHFPQAYLAVLVRPATEPVLRHNPHLDAILIDDMHGAHAGRAGFRDRLRMLRAQRFDTALMLLPSERHAWMTFLAGIRTRVGVGTKLYQMLTFTRTVSRNKYIPLRHEADYCMDLARAIGVASDDLALEIVATDDDRRAARAVLAAAGRRDGAPLVTLHPENGGSAPNWDPAEYVALARLLRATHPEVDVSVMIAPSNHALRAAFAELATEGVLLPDEGNVPGLPAGTHVDGLRVVIGLIAESTVTVSSSTGPMHLAAGLGVKTVNLFCPLTACSPKLWGPMGNRSEILLPADDYCATKCPGDPHVCTYAGGGIRVDDVAAAVGRMLGV